MDFSVLQHPVVVTPRLVREPFEIVQAEPAGTGWWLKMGFLFLQWVKVDWSLGCGALQVELRLKGGIVMG